MPFLAAVAFTVLLAALAVFQLALIAGAPWGRLAWGGQDRILPARKRAGSVVSVLLYAVFAAIALDRARVLDLVPWESFASIAMWVIAAYLALGIPLNLMSRSRPERFVMTPLVIVLVVLALIVAIG